MSIFGPYKPYVGDEVTFLQKHKLSIYSAKIWEKTWVGEVKIGEAIEGQATVRIWVICCPAKFWEFEVVDMEGIYHHIKTGSGCITEFWPSVELVAMNMFVCNQKETT